MSTNKTQNYNLHSWLPQDEFHLTEINENFTKLDAGAVRIICGTYYGNGVESGQLINLGVQPRAVIIGSLAGFSSGGSNTGGLVIRGTPTATSEIVITDTGFRVETHSIRTNIINSRYFYIAFC